LKNFREFLLAAQDARNNNLVHLSGVFDDLEELGDIMEEMLQNQEEVEVNLLCYTASS
jgi:autophagy-related protein 17